MFKFPTPRNRRWQVDIDYWDKLDPDQAHLLRKFLSEYYDGQVRVGDRDALHQTKEQRHDCYNRCKRSDRDLFAIKNCTGWLTDLSPELEEFVWVEK